MKFSITQATIADADELTSFITSIWKNMEHREWFAPEEDKDYIKSLLSTHTGIIWKAIETVSRQTAGLFIVVFPGKNSENLGYDIGLPEAELCSVAHMDTVTVHPNFRGYGLQRLLISQAEEALSKTQYRYLLCTVHPENSFSRSNMEKLGYTYIKQALKYGGLPRCIYLKKRT